MGEDNIKKYSNDDITIDWDSSKCIHAAQCVKNAGNVFRPKERPWINIEDGTTEEITNAIDKCPSGALSYRSKVD